MKIKKPEIVVIAGPNGSGKSTIINFIGYKGKYINVDDIKKTLDCTDMEAAILAEKHREECLLNKSDFTFETVLSTERNLNLLRKAKENGYFIRGYFIFTNNVINNIARVKLRVLMGGHTVPQDKILSRYIKSINNLPAFLEICDVCHVYDNTLQKPERVIKKSKTNLYYDENAISNCKEVSKLFNFDNFKNKCLND